jgi:hypothetical protein
MAHGQPPGSEQETDGKKPEKPENPSLPQQQQRILWFVLGVGIAALALGAVQFRQTLKSPFNLVARSQNANVNKAPQDQTLLALQAKDTDKDGLSDYDELYKYNTSPYIADSDSDGTPDGTEVKSGSDPNCPQGKTCGVIQGNENGNTNVNGNTNSILDIGNTNESTAQGGVTASQLREALISAGAAKSDIDAIDDATLLKSYQDVVAEDNLNTNSTAANTNTIKTNSSVTNTNASTGSTGLSVSQLQNLTPAEIRTFLKIGGVPEETLNQYDDVTLRVVFQQALLDSLPSSSNSNGNANAS